MSHRYFERDNHVFTYNKFRPSPPESIIQEIVGYTSEKFSGPLEMAVDVGCGSGQSTEIFAPFFNKVLGIDSSPSIVEEANMKNKKSNVFYTHGSADNIPIDDESVNLVSVCQSVHWFELNKFYEEVKRILLKNGVLAIYGYRLPVPVVEGAKENLSSIVQKYYEGVLVDFVLPESRKVYLENYTAKEFNELDFIDGGRMQRMDNYVLDVEGNIDDLIGYISSWSTYQNYVKKVGEEKAREILENFRTDFNNLLTRGNDPVQNFTIRGTARILSTKVLWYWATDKGGPPLRKIRDDEANVTAEIGLEGTDESSWRIILDHTLKINIPELQEPNLETLWHSMY